MGQSQPCLPLVVVKFSSERIVTNCIPGLENSNPLDSSLLCRSKDIPSDQHMKATFRIKEAVNCQAGHSHVENE